MKLEQGTYEAAKEVAEIGKIKASKDKSYFGIELTKSHLFGDKEFKTIEISIFKASMTKNDELKNKRHALNQAKVT